MKSWQLHLLVVMLIACAIIVVTSFLLFGNPVGLTVISITTGLLAAFFPAIPWFLPPIVMWLVLFMIITAVLTVILRSKP